MKLEGTGGGLGQLAATGDLAAVDVMRDLLYFLGDTEQGTTLVGVGLSDGVVACMSLIPILEIGFVGFGQSLNFDVVNDMLIVSGVVTNITTKVSSHIVFKGPAESCGPFSPIGVFGDADYVPMLHASAFDPVGQNLYVGLATSANSFAVGIIDVAKGVMTAVDAEDASSGHFLVGMKWDPSSGTLVGLESSPNLTALSLVQLQPAAGHWTVRPVATAYPIIMGNEGEVSAFDAATGHFYAQLAANTTTNELVLARVNVASATIDLSPSLGQVGLGLLLNLVFPMKRESRVKRKAHEKRQRDLRMPPWQLSPCP